MKKAQVVYLVLGVILSAVLFVQNPDALVKFVDAFVNADERQIYIDEAASSKPRQQSSAQVDTQLTPSMPVIISDSRIEHILYGDHKGGGHKYGVGKPCKSEFPKDWDDERILDVTRKIAANDNLPWARQNNGYYVVESYEDDVRVRVVKGPKKQRVITAYPTNVKRNPCPSKRPANDR